jgi:non-homologous end joining protein Ku
VLTALKSIIKLKHKGVSMLKKEKELVMERSHVNKVLTALKSIIKLKHKGVKFTKSPKHKWAKHQSSDQPYDQP